MKRTIIGGIYSLIGSIWGAIILYYTCNNLVSSWDTYLGRGFSTMQENGLLIPFILAVVLVIIGIIIISIEYFKKDE